MSEKPEEKKPFTIHPDEARKIEQRVKRELAIEAGDHSAAIVPTHVGFVEAEEQRNRDAAAKKGTGGVGGPG